MAAELACQLRRTVSGIYGLKMAIVMPGIVLKCLSFAVQIVSLLVASLSNTVDYE